MTVDQLAGYLAAKLVESMVEMLADGMVGRKAEQMVDWKVGWWVVLMVEPKAV